jgi:hypothetical protein
VFDKLPPTQREALDSLHLARHSLWVKALGLEKEQDTRKETRSEAHAS